jgi:hypothetical protein
MIESMPVPVIAARRMEFFFRLCSFAAIFGGRTPACASPLISWGSKVSTEGIKDVVIDDPSSFGGVSMKRASAMPEGPLRVSTRIDSELSAHKETKKTMPSIVNFFMCLSSNMMRRKIPAGILRKAAVPGNASRKRPRLRHEIPDNMRQLIVSMIHSRLQAAFV